MSPTFYNKHNFIIIMLPSLRWPSFYLNDLSCHIVEGIRGPF